MGEIKINLYELTQSIASNMELTEFCFKAKDLLKSPLTTIADLKAFILECGEELVTSKSMHSFKLRMNEQQFELIIDYFYEMKVDLKDLYDLVWVLNGSVQDTIVKNRPIFSVLWIKSQKKASTHRLGLLQPRKSVNRPKQGWGK